MSTDVVGTVGAGAGKIGRYFTVVSALPAAVFVSYVYLLVRTGGLSGQVRWSRLGEFHPGHLVVLGIAAFVLALALHPLQFVLIQLFEGYWGMSPVARELMLIRTLHHIRRRRAIGADELSAARAVDELHDDGSEDVAVERLRRRIIVAEAQRARGSYPAAVDDTLPTRLGNVLRRYETAAGQQYGVDPLVAVPRLAMVAKQPELAYVENQRVQLELALRTTFLAFVATLVTLIVMSRQGLWLCVALVPYLIAYLAYRGAVAVAHEYGTSLAVLIDLNRFALYDRMSLPRPASTSVEELDNDRLMDVFRLTGSAPLRYTTAVSAPSPAEEPAPAGEDSGDDTATDGGGAG